MANRVNRMQTRDFSGLPGTMRAWRDRLIDDGMPLLIAAAIVVGIAIGLDGDIRKGINGVGGILWLVAAFYIVRGAFAAGVTVMQVAITIGIILVLSSLIRPSDPLLAAIGFGWGGVAVGWIGRGLGSKLGALLGALWLPAHLLIAVARAAIRELQDKPATLALGSTAHGSSGPVDHGPRRLAVRRPDARLARAARNCYRSGSSRRKAHANLIAFAPR